MLHVDPTTKGYLDAALFKIREDTRHTTIDKGRGAMTRFEKNLRRNVQPFIAWLRAHPNLVLEGPLLAEFKQKFLEGG